jgi:hypothetical protein
VLHLLLPPQTLMMKDGPRAITGQLWMTPLWRSWQRMIGQDIRTTQDLVASVKPGETLLAVSVQYNADGYLHTALLQDGYVVDPASAALPGAMEVYRKGDRRVVELRPEDPWLLSLHVTPPFAPGSVQTNQLLLGLAAAQAMPIQRAVLLFWGGRKGEEFAESLPEYQRHLQQRSVPLGGVGAGFLSRRLVVSRLGLEPVQRTELNGMRSRLQAQLNAMQTDEDQRKTASPEDLRGIYTVEVVRHIR